MIFSGMGVIFLPKCARARNPLGECHLLTPLPPPRQRCRERRRAAQDHLRVGADRRPRPAITAPALIADAYRSLVKSESTLQFAPLYDTQQMKRMRSFAPNEFCASTNACMFQVPFPSDRNTRSAGPAKSALAGAL